MTNGEKTTFTLEHGETFEIKNLPAGADYTVNEIDPKGYDTTNVSVNGEKMCIRDRTITHHCLRSMYQPWY